MKIIRVIACVVLLLICLNTSVYGQATSIKTEGFTIVDQTLLKALADYDADNDSVLTLEELATIETLDISGLPIKSLNGIENLVNLKRLNANNCHITSLDGIRNLKKLKYLKLDGNNIEHLGDISELNLSSAYLRNNKLSDINDFAKLIEGKDSDFAFYISGNPFYEEAREYFFMNYDKKLSIIGNPGSETYQKFSPGVLQVDERAYVEFYNDLDLPEYRFEIEDISIAELGEKKCFLRISYSYSTEIHISSIGSETHGMPYMDYIQEVKLLSEGKTRMKVICGEFEKYTDIWVISRPIDKTILVEMEQISDPGFVSLLYGLSTTDTGYSKAGLLNSITTADFNGEKQRVTDFNSLASFPRIYKINLSNYSQELFEQIVNIGNSKSITNFNIINSEIETLKFNCSIPSVNKFVAIANGIKAVDVTDALPNARSIFLKDNNISSVEDINVPFDLDYLYLEGNPLPEDAAEKLFDKYMYIEDIRGLEGTSYRTMDIDIVSKDKLVFSIDNPEIAKLVDGKLHLLKPGNAILTVKYGDTEKTVRIKVDENANDDISKMGDVNGDKVISSEDALLVLKCAAKIEIISAERMPYADLTGDGIVNADDALEILKIAARIR